MVPKGVGALQSGEVVRRERGAQGGAAAGREQQGGAEAVGGSGFQTRETWWRFVRGEGRGEGLWVGVWGWGLVGGCGRWGGGGWGRGEGERLSRTVGVLGFGNQPWES